jgi:tRNA 2-thiocytidine biosynthesis protein TtcA
MSARIPIHSVSPEGTATRSAPPLSDAELAERLERKIGKAMTELNVRLGLFGEGDRVMVGISGGKDSYTLLHMLMRAQRIAPFRFEILAFHLDQGHPSFPVHRIREHLETLDVPWAIEREDTYSIVTEKVPVGQTPCSLCSRLRRGILYDAARRHGCNKVALGHHREDLIETLLLNLFYAGMMATMPPKLLNDAGDVVVIRPLAEVSEATIIEFSNAMAFPIVPCTLCGRGRDLKRDRVGRLVHELEKEIPGLSASLMNAMANIRPSHLLDEKLFDHHALGVAPAEAATRSIPDGHGWEDE